VLYYASLEARRRTAARGTDPICRPAAQRHARRAAPPADLRFHLAIPSVRIRDVPQRVAEVRVRINEFLDAIRCATDMEHPSGSTALRHPAAPRGSPTHGRTLDGTRPVARLLG